MNKIFLLIFLAAAFLWSKSWDNFVVLENGKHYFFGNDSIEIAKENISQHNLYFYAYSQCHEVDDFPENNFFSIARHLAIIKKTPNVIDDSIWLPSPTENTNEVENFITKGSFSKDFFSFFDISKGTFFEFPNSNLDFSFLESSDSLFKYILVDFFVYKKESKYKALCYILSTPQSSALYCRYQNDGSWNFEGGPIIQNSEWIWNAQYVDCSQTSNVKIKHPRFFTKKSNFLFKADGTSASEGSSNIIIKNNQPTLQLKGGH
ncbi:MAG: hypothetical protein HUK21_06520 [Fibrobacteraceae bacterium]|nr:hypothetical protein [Fibrobacteraceae bacterium]